MPHLTVISTKNWQLFVTFLPKITKIATIYVGYHAIVIVQCVLVLYYGI